MGKRHCSTLGGLPCWYALLLRFNVSSISQTQARVCGTSPWLVTSLRDDNFVRGPDRTLSDTSAFNVGRSWCSNLLKYTFSEGEAFVWLEIQLTLLWDVSFCLRCFEMFWDVLRCFEMFWDVLRCSEMFWDVLRCFEMFWDVLRCFEMFWDVLRCF